MWEGRGEREGERERGGSERGRVNPSQVYITRVIREPGQSNREL